MIQEIANISQQQFILILGIIIVVLLLLDAYRRMKRKKYQVTKKMVSDVEITKSSDADVTSKKGNNTNENNFKKDVEVNDSVDEGVPEAGDQNIEGEVTTIGNTTKTKNKATRDEEISESPEDIPEASTWEEALQLKQKQQIEDRHELQQENISVSSNQDDGKSIHSSLKQGIITLYIMAPRAYVFYGEDLKIVFDYYHLNYSQEFQSFQGISENSEVLFNIMTATKPGVFNLNNINELQTSGISIFMEINSLSNPRERFKQMLSLLYKITENLGGTLLNESRSRFTQSDVSRITASIRNIESPAE